MQQGVDLRGPEITPYPGKGVISDALWLAQSLATGKTHSATSDRLPGQGGTSTDPIHLDIPGANAAIANAAVTKADYTIDGDWNQTGEDKRVYLTGLEPSSFSPVGILQDAQGTYSFVQVDVANATTAPAGVDAYTKPESDAQRTQLYYEISLLRALKTAQAVLLPLSGPPAEYPTYAAAEAAATAGDTILLFGYHAVVQVTKSVQVVGRGASVGIFGAGACPNPITATISDFYATYQVAVLTPQVGGTAGHTITFERIMLGPNAFFTQFSLGYEGTGVNRVTVRDCQGVGTLPYSAPGAVLGGMAPVRYQERPENASSQWVVAGSTRLESTDGPVVSGYQHPASRLTLQEAALLVPGGGHPVQEVQVLNSNAPTADADFFSDQRFLKLPVQVGAWGAGRPDVVLATAEAAIQWLGLNGTGAGTGGGGGTTPPATPAEITVFGHSQNSDEAAYPWRLPSWPTIMSQSAGFAASYVLAGNPSVAGATLADALGQLNNYSRPVTAGKVGVFSLWCLINDAGQGRTATQIQDDVLTWITAARGKYPGVKINLLTEPYGHAELFYPALTNAQIYAAADEVRAWALAGNSGADIVEDLRADHRLDQTTYQGSGQNAPDGLHHDLPRRTIVALEFELPGLAAAAAGQTGILTADGLRAFGSAAAAPAISSASATAGPIGSVFTLTGTRLAQTKAVTLGGVACVFAILSTTSLQVTVPTGASTGVLAIVGESASGSGGTFTVTAAAAPTVTALSTTSPAIGAELTVTGTNFLSAATVSFGGVAGTSVSVLSATSLTVVVPVGATAGNLTVATTSGTSNAVAYTIGAANNRALQFNGTSQYAVLPDGGTNTALGGGLPFTIEFRVRADSLPSSFVFALARDASGQAEYAAVYNLAASTWTFYSTANSTGGTINFPLTIATPPGDFHTIKFDYTGTALNGYVDGQPAGTRSGAFSLTATPGASLHIAHLGGQAVEDYKFPGTFDWLRITRDGSLIVDLEFDATTGTYVNTGTAGGTLVLTGSPASVIL